MVTIPLAGAAHAGRELAFPLKFHLHGSGKFRLLLSAFGSLFHLPAPTSRNPSVRALPE